VDNSLQLFRIRFDKEEFLKLPEEDQIFFVQLAQVADDLRHVFFLCVAAEKGTKSPCADERKIALHQLLFGVRLIYSTLNEGWKVTTERWSENALGQRWHPQLSQAAKDALAFLGRYFAKPNLTRTIRDHFGSHYLSDHLREPLAHVPQRAAEIISGKHNGNIFYTLAEEVRALAMLQVAADPDAPKIWDENASESDIRYAAIRLYESFKPVREAFDQFANTVLVTIIKSLPHRTENFAAPAVMNFDEMRTPLFVEERPSHIRT
jgi:hypothetical protein